MIHGKCWECDLFGFAMVTWFLNCQTYIPCKMPLFFCCVTHIMCGSMQYSCCDESLRWNASKTYVGRNVGLLGYAKCSNSEDLRKATGSSQRSKTKTSVVKSKSTRKVVDFTAHEGPTTDPRQLWDHRSIKMNTASQHCAITLVYNN